MADNTNTRVPLERIRNIGIIAHIDAGKTTTSERILYFTGRTYKIGEVHEGAATMDWMAQEQERGITIVSAATTCFWKPHFEVHLENALYRFNIIDTPGHVDFTAEVERSLRVLDGGITVLDASEGVQSQSETVWRQADKYNIPRICFINKMDKLGADFFATIEDIRVKFGVTPAVMVLPMGAENDFRGVIQILEQKALFWKDSAADTEPEVKGIPEEYKARVAELRSQLIEQIAETDDELLQKFFDGKEIALNVLKTALRKAVIDYKLVPVYAGSSLKNTGVQPMLDAVVDYLPSPVDIDHITGINPKTQEEETRQLVTNEKFCALAFKIQTDPHVGKITYTRVYSGVLKAGSYTYNSSTKQKERVGRLLLMHANQREEIQEAKAGEIVAIVGLKNTRTGDTLCDEDSKIVLEGITFAEPVISLSIEPKTKSDQEKMGMALAKLSEEDPTFSIKSNPDTGQTIIGGMGELHLEIIVDRMKREFSVEANVGTPQVAYRETITKTAQAEGKYIKQSGGRGQYGHVFLRIEPKDRGTGYEFVNGIKGGTVPREFIKPTDKGVQESLERGFLAHFPMSDIKVTLYDGSYHDVDSSEIAFKMAGSLAMRHATLLAGMVLLEPIMKVEISTPDEYMGDVIGDLGSRRAQIQGTTTRGSVTIITALAPLAEMQGYVTILRSMTKGRASSVMLPSHYDIVPNSITEKLVAERKTGGR
ncbi:MAG: elongation factor G [Candidatus Pacebacteria bacterium CG_4_10_14_3_um_filter_34_15]|nr:elongation factor G [Candidatus Pacearchaeota archaeon]NCQ65243.1 elongation factor G [Candidatus Paceibacterota bacterium]OIO45030.1 MAG: translation elongation factor G [Candidatus Pacebacteria bacterium CG1_02_43_31]PIQ81022.1 MAG: elongation factor G [Candidatus Pacebacteria bacterium CG11_big_fil_rev_8_21_14_0_20_34_55]PIX81839.1 MAG: elongation factor G [Candidatus Pacebacteria bacterium CG_4_10_14_3_um_filter_34_15]PJC44054.1 MAG: elongation factor G [Candidatus Pacebacteria bacteriu